MQPSHFKCFQQSSIIHYLHIICSISILMLEICNIVNIVFFLFADHYTKNYKILNEQNSYKNISNSLENINKTIEVCKRIKKKLNVGHIQSQQHNLLREDPTVKTLA